MSEYKVHPAAELFPMLDQPELQALADDIKKNGLLQPIVLCGNEIIDGRNRLAACKLADIEPIYQAPPADEIGNIVNYVISANIARRHLSTAQRAAIAAELATLKVGTNQHPREGGSNDPPSTAKAATMLNVSTASVKRAKTTMKTDPAAHAAVKAGKPKPKKPFVGGGRSAAERKELKAKFDQAMTERGSRALPAAGAERAMVDTMTKVLSESMDPKVRANAARALLPAAGGWVRDPKANINQCPSCRIVFAGVPYRNTTTGELRCGLCQRKADQQVQKAMLPPQTAAAPADDDGGYGDLVKAWTGATKNAKGKFIEFRAKHVAIAADGEGGRGAYVAYLKEKPKDERMKEVHRLLDEIDLSVTDFVRKYSI